MKKSPYKIILIAVLLGIGIAFSVLMSNYGVMPVVLTVLLLALITLWVWFFFSIFSGKNLPNISSSVLLKNLRNNSKRHPRFILWVTNIPILIR